MRKYLLISEVPVPIWVVDGTSKPSDNDPPVDEMFTKLIKEEHDFPEYRGVTIERLTSILLIGVDVEPADAPFYASDIDKAWEYPSMYEPRAVFAIRKSMMKPSWSMLSADATPEQIAEVQREYPHQHENGNTLWFSRIAEQGRPLGYEAAYGYWIPGSAQEALVAVFLFGNDTAELLVHAAKALKEWRDATSVDTN